MERERERERERVLVVDDDAAVRQVLAALLTQAGFEVLRAGSGDEALRVLERQPVDVIVSDVRMPGLDGMALLARVRREWPEIPVILLTAHASVTLAVEAMKAGAHDFVEKPFEREGVLFVVRKALRATSAGRDAPPRNESSVDLLGVTEALDEVRERIRRAAASNATVLIRGETGTGKELVARSIHTQSARRGGPFVALNCAAVPENLLESELFGYEKGAFTGAASRKPGRVELSEGGTLFLDEVGDVPLSTQVKLLRVLQERAIERLGGTASVKVDVRFLAATHRNLEDLMAQGKFREDFFYRLNVIPIEVPPLRERSRDIEALARHFCQIASRANNKTLAELEPGVSQLLASQPWPGNVRQLENFVERLVVLSDGPTITLADAQRELARESARR
ncbi:MAG TPA: sigma-54 dependent transcriptional regulator, partial [Polyangiaceae bacterium]|nr:sigma-54 dependent transcriptional regulator [Polyangiaceae bacterium]